jgi:hypothetical protein
MITCDTLTSPHVCGGEGAGDFSHECEVTCLVCHKCVSVIKNVTIDLKSFAPFPRDEINPRSRDLPRPLHEDFLKIYPTRHTICDKISSTRWVRHPAEDSGSIEGVIRDDEPRHHHS